RARPAIASRSVSRFSRSRERTGAREPSALFASPAGDLLLLTHGLHQFHGVPMRPLTLGRLLFRCGILAALLFVVVVVALKMGAVQVSLYGLGRDLIRVLLGQSSAISTDYGMIVVDIRLPRILLGIVVGASLSVAGASFQALLRNPLADPYVLESPPVPPSARSLPLSLK